ncbi:MAG: hypothetical protein U1E65_15195 [Myxococcota bacterium]
MLSIGCGDKIDVFPPGLEPIEQNRADFPPASDGDRYPEMLSFASGEGHDVAWAHSKGYIHAPLSMVWSAFQEPVVVVDRRKVAEWTITDNVETGFDRSFLVHNIVHNVITVSFDVTWRESATVGTTEAPRTVAIRFQKTFGTVFIDILRGSVVLRQGDDPSVTEIEEIEQIAAAQGGVDNIQSYLTDLYQSVTARVHGQALPTY